MPKTKKRYFNTWKGQTQGLGDTTIHMETEDSIHFIEQEKKFC